MKAAVLLYISEWIGFFAFVFAGFELLSEESKKSFEKRAKKLLSPQAVTKSIVLAISCVLATILLMAFSGYVLAACFFLLFWLANTIMNFAFTSKDGKRSVLGAFAVILAPLGILYFLAWISSITPFQHLYVLFTPLEYISNGISRIPIVGHLLPRFSQSAYDVSFTSTLNGIEHWFKVDQIGKWKYLSPYYTLGLCKGLMMFIGLLIVEGLFIYALLRLVAAVSLATLFPFYSGSNYIRLRSGLVDSPRMPVMGILLGMLSILIKLLVGPWWH